MSRSLSACRFIREGKCCDLPKAMRDRRKVLIAILLDGFADLLQPFRAGLLVRGCSIRTGSNSSSVRRTAMPSAPEDVSICSKAGQMRWASAITPSAAVTGSTFATARISELADFNRLDGLG